MALFKVLHGSEANISTDITPFHEGWCYITHDGCFYADLNTGTEKLPNNQRIKLKSDVQTVNGQFPDESGNVSIDVATKMSQLENDSGYIKNTVTNLAYYYDKNNTYNKTETNELISAIPKFKRQVVDALPEVGNEETLYLLRISNTDEVNTNLFEEWIWVEGAWESLGAQEIDLVDYTLKEEVPNMVTEVLKKVYAVGAIYISATNVNPAELFGFGEWTQIKDRFLLSAGDTYAAGTTGGEATHELTVDEMPKHTHEPTTSTVTGATTYTDYYFNLVRNLESESTAKRKVAAGTDYSVVTAKSTASDYTDKDLGVSSKTAPTGGNAAHNNMPPYLAVYVWQRTA